MAIMTLGIDLAKNVFALHGGVNEVGKAELQRPKVTRPKPRDRTTGKVNKPTNKGCSP